MEKQIYKKMFIESFKDRNGKFDHKRMTVFAFVIMFLLTGTVALFREKEIVNSALIEHLLTIEGGVIVGGMGLSMYKKPTREINNIENG